MPGEFRLDEFDKAREAVWQLPGFQVKQSTIVSPGSAWLPGGTWIVETVITDDTQAIFLQFIGADGSKRIVLPDRVTKAIYRQYQDIMKKRRCVAAQRGAETRKQKAQREAV